MAMQSRFLDFSVAIPVLRAAAYVGALLGLETVIVHLILDPLVDVRAYYDAGARLNAGLPLYLPAADPNAAEFYRYPPLLAIGFRALALLPYPRAVAIWEAIVIAATALTLVRLGLTRRTLMVAGWLALPTLWGVVIGQAQAIVTLLLVIGSPFSVALAGHLKVFPALAAVYWLGRRDWRSLSTFVLCGAALTLIQLVLEPRGTVAYLNFLSLDQVGNVASISLYQISPILWGISVAALFLAALRLASTRWGWPAAVVLSVFATPRLLVYQLGTLLAGLRSPQPPSPPEAPRRLRTDLSRRM